MTNQAPSLIKIGIWGMPKSGKSTYVLMLCQNYQKNHAHWTIEAMDDDTREFIKNGIEQWEMHRRFVEKTHEIATYRFKITPKQHASSYELCFVDAPGELYENFYHNSKRSTSIQIPQADRENRTSPAPEKAFEKLRDCTGILMFIDPGAVQTEISISLQIAEFLEMLKKDNRPRYIALCIVKADALDEGNKKLTELVPNAAHCALGNSVLDQYGNRIADATPNPCESTCLVYKTLGREFMERLPGIHSHEYIRCFVMSSVGRTTQNQPNTSTKAPWIRKPKASPLKVVTSSTGVQDLITANPEKAFYPLRINDHNQVNQFNLLAPIDWIISKAQTSRSTGPTDPAHPKSPRKVIRLTQKKRRHTLLKRGIRHQSNGINPRPDLAAGGTILE